MRVLFDTALKRRSPEHSPGFLGVILSGVSREANEIEGPLCAAGSLQ